MPSDWQGCLPNDVLSVWNRTSLAGPCPGVQGYNMSHQNLADARNDFKTILRKLGGLYYPSLWAGESSYWSVSSQIAI